MQPAKEDIVKKTALLVLALLFLSLSLTAEEPAPVKDTLTSRTMESLFPVEKGLRWKYQRNSPEGLSYYVTDSFGSIQFKGDTYHLIGNPRKVSYYLVTPEIISTPATAESVEDSKPVFYEGDPMVRLRMPLEKGNRWMGAYRLDEGGRAVYSAYITEIFGREKITVPLGTYDTLVTSSTLNTMFYDRAKGEGKGNRTLEHIWYAPGLGIVRRQTSFEQPEGDYLLYRDDQLVEFTKPPAK